MQTLNVSETFSSIQGESTYAGLPCFFIRLAGCNLDCSYCDTPHAKMPGNDVATSDLVNQCIEANTPITEITGGEPLMQAGAAVLAAELYESTGRPVLIETNGSCDISVVTPDVVAIMDIKTPSSGMSEKMDMMNIERLRPHDEVKFVMADRDDYNWACNLVKAHDLIAKCHAVLFSPVGDRLDPSALGRWISDDGLPVRLQLQLHKILGIR